MDLIGSSQRAILRALVGYVRLASGKKYLFIGDCAWHMDGVVKLRHKNVPLFKEKRAAVMSQLQWLNQINQKEKNITFVVGHTMINSGLTEKQAYWVLNWSRIGKEGNNQNSRALLKCPDTIDG
jgi:hypothetical protein